MPRCLTTYCSYSISRPSISRPKPSRDCPSRPWRRAWTFVRSTPSATPTIHLRDGLGYGRQVLGGVPHRPPRPAKTPRHRRPRKVRFHSTGPAFRVCHGQRAPTSLPFIGGMVARSSLAGRRPDSRCPLLSLCLFPAWPPPKPTRAKGRGWAESTCSIMRRSCPAVSGYRVEVKVARNTNRVWRTGC